MYGYPKIIKTRTDVEYLVGYLGSKWATPANIERGLAFLQGLLDSTRYYVIDRALDEGESPDGDEPEHHVVIDEDGIRRQYKLADNPSARIHKLGLTEAEVGALIDTVKGAK